METAWTYSINACWNPKMSAVLVSNRNGLFYSPPNIEFADHLIACSVAGSSSFSCCKRVEQNEGATLPSFCPLS